MTGVAEEKASKFLHLEVAQSRREKAHETEQLPPYPARFNDAKAKVRLYKLSDGGGLFVEAVLLGKRPGDISFGSAEFAARSRSEGIPNWVSRMRVSATSSCARCWSGASTRLMRAARNRKLSR